MNVSEYLDKESEDKEKVKSFSDYRPPTGYIKCFSVENSDVVVNDEKSKELAGDESAKSVPGIDGTDTSLIGATEDIEEVNDQELTEFVTYLMEMARLGDTYSIASFSKAGDADRYQIKQFSIKIKEYVKERLRNPRVVFNYRIRQFFTYINHTKVEVLSYSLFYAVQYIKEYFEQYITSAMNGLANSNIMLGLGIARWIPDKKSVRILQRDLRKAARELSATGVMQKITQKRLWDSFRTVFASLMEGISYKIKDPIKRDLLMAAVTGSSNTKEQTMLVGEGVEDEDQNKTA